MRNRRNLSSIVRDTERGFKEFLQTIGITSSVSANGKIVNAQSHSDGEVRELKPALPYGIASSSMDGMPVQIIINSATDSTMVGVIDKNRPDVEPGGLILYSKGGAKIHLKADGNIVMTPGSGGKIYID